MLQPNRTKYRKDQKGRNYGLAQRGAKVSFGQFGLKVTERGRLTARQIEAAVVRSLVTSSAAAVYGSASSRTNPFPPNRLKSVWVMVKAIPNSGLLWFSRAASFMNLTVLMKHLLVKLSALLRPSFRSSPCSLHVKSASNRSAE